MSCAPPVSAQPLAVSLSHTARGVCILSRMPQVTIYLNAELAAAVKAADMPVSEVCQKALRRELRRTSGVKADPDERWLTGQLPTGGRNE